MRSLGERGLHQRKIFRMLSHNSFRIFDCHFQKNNLFLCYPWQRYGRRFQLLGIHCSISGDEKEQQVHFKANSWVHIQTIDIKNDATFQGWNRPQETAIHYFPQRQVLMKAWKRMRKTELWSRIFGHLQRWRVRPKEHIYSSLWVIFTDYSRLPSDYPHSY